MAEEREYQVLSELSKDRNLLQDGELFIRFKNPDIIKRLLWDWLDKELETTVKIFRRNRSNAQNNYLWGVMVPVVRSWLKNTEGIVYTPDEVYLYLNSSILGNKPVIKLVAGEEVIVMTGKRWSKKNTKEFSDDVNTIVDYYAQKGLVIPLPKDGTNNLLDNFLTDD